MEKFRITGRRFDFGQRGSHFPRAAALCSALVLPLLGQAPSVAEIRGGENGGPRGEGARAGWPCFRGPSAGHSLEADLPVRWNVADGTNIRWKSSVPRPGQSSPVVRENRLFLTGADPVVRQIYCYDTETGKLLWEHDVDGIDGAPEQELPKVLPDTGFAASTPVTNGRLVAAVFATGELVCVNVGGERVWAKHLGLPDNHYGHASSLQVHGNWLIVQFDQHKNSSLCAFDFESGGEVWKLGRGAVSWSSPILVENQGRKELILTNSKSVDSYDPETGKRLWHVDCLAGEVATSAAYADGIVFVASEGAKASAIDIRDHGEEPKILWQWETEALPDASSPVANGKYLFFPTGFGAVSCLDARSGKVHWEHEFEEGFYSSPILVRDRVYITDFHGNTQVFRVGDEFELLGSASVGEDVFATPAFVGGRIYLRGATRIFCIEGPE